jgi:tRNA-2-methylthio-N6-dimethylallyladenosine synthase
MLRRMIRRYTRKEYVERVDRLRRARPLTLSTDVIVGFPGETAADFDETLSLVREVGFVSLFGFKFSPRPHTPALKLADDVPEEEKSERLTRLFELAEEQGRAHLAGLIGTRQEVLVEGPSKGESTAAPRVSGRTVRNEIVHVEAPPGRAIAGEIVVVEITRAFRHSLEGRLTAESLAGLPAGRSVLRRRELPVLA